MLVVIGYGSELTEADTTHRLVQQPVVRLQYDAIASSGTTSHYLRLQLG